MIYTVTANPSIDYVIGLDQLNIGLVNRMTSDVKLPGGKGINVSRILKQLDTPSTALGFVGGFTGEFIQAALEQDELPTNLTPIKEDTRINVKLKAAEETEINGQGPHISAAEAEQFRQNLDELQADDTVVMSGSLPQGLPETFYKDLIPLIQKHHAQFVIDTTGQALLDTLPDHPLLVKPNNHELAALFNVELNSKADIVTYGRKLLDMGAQHVLVSMAGDGAMMITKDKAYFGTAAPGEVKNSVGAGDSMIAGFVGTFAKTHDPLKSFHMGCACGSATTFSEDLATRAKIDAVYQTITVTEFN
ncbi:1-phosphofructokinase [Lactobacillus selangorensis]|uniref:Tagatose-6-phosphate kinase n=1 Tax=Lactobacillus selangorensis TaxID=81857 RepID=A0A0R2FLI2_9LACO|nr:1-phosphofructokinase [Lactobacillus selangorensis]KRN29416.1 1-phosphofructokinase [Lactobacillus selangorensis]KRN34055.1 1-phosphofructokinase [Lactobacillus selangorensis]